MTAPTVVRRETAVPAQRTVARLARVAVLWSAASYSAYLVADAARDLCSPVWVVDASDPATARMTRLLRRFGPVVDVAGRSADDAADELRTLEVGAVATFTDAPIPFGAEIARRLGAIFHSPETAVFLTDKLAQRAALAAAGVPSAVCALVPAGSPPPTTFPLPAVVKPRSGAASRDVSFVATEAELVAALTGCDEDMLVEEYLPDRTVQHPYAADMVSVESVVVAGEITHLAVTGRFPLAPPFREAGDYLPYDGTPDETTDILTVAAQAARAVGVRDAFLHTEVKRTPDGPRVVEVNGRLGQGIPEMTARAGGANLVRQALLLALGRPLEPFPALTGVGWFLMAHAPADASEVVAVDGLDAARALPGVTDVRVNRAPGAALSVREGTAGHVYAVDGVAADHAAVFAARAAVLAAVRVATR